MHNFYIDNETCVEGWPEHVRVVSNGIDIYESVFTKEDEPIPAIDNKRIQKRFIRPLIEHPSDRV